MKNNRKSDLVGINEHTKGYEEYVEDSFYDDLEERIRNKSYREKYKGFKTLIEILSYIFNVASGATASFAVYWLMHLVVGNMWVSIITAITFLVFFEIIKRRSSKEVWEEWFFNRKIQYGWVLLSLACFSVSLFASGFGVKKGTNELSPDVELLKKDSTITSIEYDIAALEAENKELKENKNRQGVTFYKLYDGINANIESIAQLRSRKNKLETSLEGKNEMLDEDYQELVQNTGWALVGITIFFELLFEMCIAFIFYYYKRCLVERRKILEKQESDLDEFTVHEISPSPTPQAQDVYDVILQKLGAMEQRLNKVSTHEYTVPKEKSVNGANVMNYRPIGFRREHMSTHENRPKIIISDKYTIPHTYTRSGKPHTVHYNIITVRNRIGEYEKKIQEAKDSKMSERAILNRKRWLEYWQGKEVELINKAQQDTAKA